jgi:hypothetical protein
MKTLSRREMFRTFGSAALLVHPIVNARTSFAQAPTGKAKRLLSVFMTNGGASGRAFPTGTGTGFNLAGSMMAPLEKWKNELLVIKGVQLKTAPTDDHGALQCCYNGNKGIGFLKYGTGPTLDYYVASRIGQADPIKFLNLWVSKADNKSMRSCLTYDDKHNPLHGERDVVKAYANVAKLLTCSNTPMAPMPTTPAEVVDPRRKTILDAIRRDLADAKRRLGLGHEELIKVESHEAAVASLERRISNLGAQGASFDQVCKAGGLVDSLEMRSKNAGMATAEISRFMMDLAVVSFAANLTKVASIVYFGEGGHGQTRVDFASYQGKPMTHGAHEVSHEAEFVGPTGVEKHFIVKTWFYQEAAYLYDSLSKIADGDSNLLKTTLTNCFMSFASGRAHGDGLPGMPIVLTGGGGYFKPGQLVEQTGARFTRVLISMVHAMGFTEVKKFGNLVEGDAEMPLV